MSDQEKRKINKNRDKIREFVKSKTSQKKRKENLVQEGGAFLIPLLAPVHGSLVGHYVYTELTCDTEVTWTVAIELSETRFKQYFVKRTRTNDL